MMKKTIIKVETFLSYDGTNITFNANGKEYRAVCSGGEKWHPGVDDVVRLFKDEEGRLCVEPDQWRDDEKMEGDDDDEKE